MLKSRRLKWSKYPHREKWLIANLKDEPGKRPLGSSTARRKPTKTSALIRYSPPPIHGSEAQPSQHPACVRRLTRRGGNLTPWAAGRRRPVPCSSHRRDISIQGIQESRLQKQSNRGYCACSRAPSSSSTRSSREKGIFTLGPFQDLHFPTMSSSSFLNTLQICSLQALNWSRLLSLPAGDAPVSILLKKETLVQDFT